MTKTRDDRSSFGLRHSFGSPVSTFGFPASVFPLFLVRRKPVGDRVGQHVERAVVSLVVPQARLAVLRGGLWEGGLEVVLVVGDLRGAVRADLDDLQRDGRLATIKLERAL